MKKRIISLALAGIIAASGAVAVSAEDAPENAKGIKFKADSAYHLNTYTGYVGGAELGVTAGEILGALENKNGVVIIGDSKRADDDAVKHGDTIGVKKDGVLKDEFHIIFMGNADKNNKFNLGDASAMLKKVAKWDVDIDEVAADVDGNGTLNLSDISAVLKKIAKWDVKFASPVLPGKGSGRISSTIATFDSGERANINLRRGQDYAVKFSVSGEGQYAKYVRAQYPSWGDSKGSLRLSIYKWDTDYETTVSNDPIYSEKHVDFADNAEITFNLTDTSGKGLGKGEYLWRIHEGYEDTVELDLPGGVGMWTYDTPAADKGVTVFFEGEALEPGTKAYGPEAYIGIGD